MKYMTAKTLEEVQAMYESVKEYKGFYIARYEAGVDVEKHKTSADGIIIKDVHSKMNKAPYNYIPWTENNVFNEDTNGAVEVARSIYPEYNENYGVVSTLTYSVQWDRTLAWWIESKAQNGTKDVTIDSKEKLQNSTNYGNYKDSEISTFNDGARVSIDKDVTKYQKIDSTYTKQATLGRLLTTGATEQTRVNNIYAMAGNLYEWTMEGYMTDGYRVLRGGFYNGYGSGTTDDRHPVVKRHTNELDYLNNSCRGFRPALYIK
jgi:hypothetical protein